MWQREDSSPLKRGWFLGSFCFGFVCRNNRTTVGLELPFQCWMLVRAEDGDSPSLKRKPACDGSETVRRLDPSRQLPRSRYVGGWEQARPHLDALWPVTAPHWSLVCFRF